HNRASHEVSAVWVVNAIAAAHSDYTLAKQSFEDKCVPKLELGNEGRGCAGAWGRARNEGAKMRACEEVLVPRWKFLPYRDKGEGGWPTNR
ncbi:MAG TPA: hypothetical protein VEX43_01305, partial [Chthoniobacterales bacterium]|nr:hypothetical protein [Chthoniobacterales bacterium]